MTALNDTTTGALLGYSMLRLEVKPCPVCVEGAEDNPTNVLIKGVKELSMKGGCDTGIHGGETGFTRGARWGTAKPNAWA